MAKLDLSALKKQKITSGTPLVTLPTQASVSQNEVVEVISPISSEVTTSLPLATPQKEPEIMRAFENPHKPKLSLSNFKKPSSTSPVSSAPAVVSQMAPAVVEKVATIAPAVAAEPVVEIVAQEVISRETEMPAAPVNEVVEITPDSEVSKVLDIEPVVAVDVASVESKVAPLGAEFFPNLEFENDNLFDDIVGMGSFGEEKAEKPVEVIATPAEIQAEAIAPESSEVPVETVVMEALPSVSQVEEIVSDEIQPVEVVSMNESTGVVATMEALAQSTNETTTAEVGASTEVTLGENAPAVVTLEHVETVARDLSKERKGGLKALFDNHKKVFYGVGAFMFTSVLVVGGLSGLGLIDMGGTKASTFEKSQVVAIKTSPETPTPLPKKTPDVVAPVLTATGVTTLTGANTGTGQVVYPPVVVTSSGTSMVVSGTGGLVPPKGTGSVTLTGATLTGSGILATSNGTGSTQSGVTTKTGAVLTAVAPQTQTGTVITTATPGTTINTYRTPNNKSKNRK